MPRLIREFEHEGELYRVVSKLIAGQIRHVAVIEVATGRNAMNDHNWKDPPDDSQALDALLADYLQLFTTLERRQTIDKTQREAFHAGAMAARGARCGFCGKRNTDLDGLLDGSGSKGDD
jgi:hypothetical protein